MARIGFRNVLPMLTVYFGINSRMRKKRAFCKCTILCYILEYIYIVQIEKRHTRTVLAFNMQNTTKDSSVFYLIAYLHVERKQDLCVSLLFVQYRYTSICNTKKVYLQDKIRSISPFSKLYQCIHWYRKDM